MNKKSGTSKDAADKLVKGIKRKTRKQYSAEEKIRIVLAGLRGEESIAALCRRRSETPSRKPQQVDAMQAPLARYCGQISPSSLKNRGAHKALHGATRERKALTLQLVPCLAHTIDLIVFIPNPFDLWLQFRISLLSRRCFGRIGATYEAVIEC
jgi:transposase